MLCLILTLFFVVVIVVVVVFFIYGFFISPILLYLPYINRKGHSRERTPPPMSAILSQDITQPLDLPANRSNLSIREQQTYKAYDNDPWLFNSIDNIIDLKFIKTNRDLLFQILIIENISISKLNQIDNINLKLNPKLIKVDTLKNSKQKSNYKIINQIDIENDNDSSSPSTSIPKNNNVYKLTIQSKDGTIFNAISSTTIPWNSCALGSKIIIKLGTIFNRGVFIINDTNCIFLGGINLKWNENKDLKLLNLLETKLDIDNNNNNNTSISKKRKHDL